MVDWSFYNKSLVRRGEVILDFDVIDGWYSELDSMNNGRRGAQYHYPKHGQGIDSKSVTITRLLP
ncbi:MAG: hypothetical protein WBX01_08305 [Nitrososphaeraceae archaeon]